MVIEFFTVCFCFLVSLADKTGVVHSGDKLIIVSTRGEKNPDYIAHNVNDTLELTCRLNIQEDVHFNLEWQVPPNTQNSKTRQNVILDGKNLTLRVENLQERDTGDYACEAFCHDPKEIIRQTLHLTVKAKRDPCRKMFFCEPEKCIHHRFTCDGKHDCSNGADESRTLCGEDPCEGKIKCEGRCIPVSWCCYPYESNCASKVRPRCCPNVKHVMNKGYIGDDAAYVPNQMPPSYGDMTYSESFIQTAIFSVVGCALVFVVIVTAFVVAIYRVHWLRSLNSSVPQRRETLNSTRYHRTFSHDVGVQNLGVYMNPHRDHIPANLLVTYNINNGVQILGDDVEPPPYSEIVTPPPREGPPPPYSPSDENPHCFDDQLTSRLPRSESLLAGRGLSNTVSSEPALSTLH